MPHPSCTLRRSARLSAAVALGGGMLLGTAAPALAAWPAGAPAGVTYSPFVADTPAWTPEHGVPYGDLAPFWDDESGFLIGMFVMDEFAAEDIRVTARPAGAGETAEVTVPHRFESSTFPGADTSGSVTHAAVRAAVGDGPAEVSLYVDGSLLSRMDLPSAEALAEQPPVLQGAVSYPVTVHGFGRLYPFAEWPAQRDVYYVSNVAPTSGDHAGDYTDAFEFMNPLGTCGLQVNVADAPDHGRLVEGGGDYSYAQERGYAGEDSFTLAVSDGAVTKTVDVHVLLTEDYLTFDFPRSSWTTTCAWPTGEETPAAPGNAPQAPAESAPEADHVLPDRVETGNGAAWWFAGLAAAGLAVLVRFRRAFGLA